MKKRNANKGFSLVELIIVIAIMAVLIGVLGPQYLKFVESSRKSTDKQNVDAIISALQVYAVDVTATTPLDTAGGKITLTPTETAVSSTNATGNAHLALDAAGIKKIGLKSKEWKIGSQSKVEISFTYSASTGVVVTVTPNMGS